MFRKLRLAMSNNQWAGNPSLPRDYRPHTADAGSNSPWRRNKDINTTSSRSEPSMTAGACCAATFSLVSTNDFRERADVPPPLFFRPPPPPAPVHAVHANEPHTCHAIREQVPPQVSACCQRTPSRGCCVARTPVCCPRSLSAA